MKTVYVLGAGASKHVGYPLASRMGDEMLAWMSTRDRYQDTAEAIEETFGAAPNIEDVITALDNIIVSLEDAKELEDRERRTIAAHQRSKLAEVLPQWFVEIHGNPAPAYQQFAGNIVQPGDVIITFNYDDSLERELKRVGKWDVSQGYGFQIGNVQKASPVPTFVTLPREERALAVAQTILRNPAEPKTMAALCAKAGVSVRTIERTFRNEVGTSFVSWRRQVRLTKAVELLVSGCSIKEVAYKVGYCQSSAFVEIFRRTFGTTPKAWVLALNSRA